MHFFDIMDAYNVSVQSGLDCDPSYANQFVCLVLATIVVDVVIRGMKRAAALILGTLVSQKVRDGLLKEAISGLKDSGKPMIEWFDEWARAAGIEHNATAEIEKFRKPVESSKEISWEEAVDAYMMSESTRKIWMECTLVATGNGMAMNVQHMVAALFGLWALVMTSDQNSFLAFARWGVLLEVGFEAVDTFKIILIALTTDRFGFGNFMGLIHHQLLFIFLPVNRTFLPSSYLGQDIAMTIVLYTGVVAINEPLRFMKNNADITTPKGLRQMCICQVLMFLLWFTTRGLHWPYLAYKMLNFALSTGWVSWVYFIPYALGVALFSMFNLIVVYMVYKGTKKTFKLAKKNASHKDVQEEMTKRKKRSSMIDVALQEMITPITTEGSRKSSGSRTSLMGVDFELDDDELEEVHARRKSMGHKNGRPSLFSALAFSGEDIKED